MTMKTEYRACVTIGALIAATLVLSGCLGPTYGTDKTATEQLDRRSRQYRVDREYQ
jgi:outer membrane murein-binding lipoprotein Lpp